MSEPSFTKVIISSGLGVEDGVFEDDEGVGDGWKKFCHARMVVDVLSVLEIRDS